MKRSPLRRHKRMNKVRAKTRPGRKRGKDMKRLREDSWDQHKGKCIFCGLFVAFEEMELAHRRGKRIHGDNLENVGPAHRKCHRDSHNSGGKPCPPKPPELRRK